VNHSGKRDGKPWKRKLTGRCHWRWRCGQLQWGVAELGLSRADKVATAVARAFYSGAAGWGWTEEDATRRPRGGVRVQRQTGGARLATARSQQARGAGLGRGGEGGSLSRGTAAQCQHRGSNNFETDSKFKPIQLNSNPLQL
jgi:hypothetical protein